MLQALGGQSKFTQKSRQIAELKMGIQPTGIGQHPAPGAADRFILPSELRIGAIEGSSIRADSENRDDSWSISSHLPLQSPRATTQIIGTQLTGGRGCMGHDIGNPKAQWQKLALVERGKLPIRESRPMQRRPETIAGPRKMVARGGRVQAGIDPAEQNSQIGCDHIRHGFAVCGAKLCGRGFEWLVDHMRVAWAPRPRDRARVRRPRHAAVVANRLESDNEPMSQRDEALDSLRIRQAVMLRRNLNRSRSYALIAALACLAGAAQCALLAWRQINSAGWTGQALLFILLLCGLFAATFWLVRRAHRLHREAQQAHLPEPTTPPDFSTLSDGSQRAANLTRVADETDDGA